VISSLFSKPLVTPSTRLAICARAVPWGDRDDALVELHLDVVMHDELKLALRPLHLDGLALDVRSNARGNRHRPFADT
jgi:hypothetical protein